MTEMIFEIICEWTRIRLNICLILLVHIVFLASS
nr:unnamed protein product [Callosobruchus chinensis]